MDAPRREARGGQPPDDLVQLLGHGRYPAVSVNPRCRPSAFITGMNWTVESSRWKRDPIFRLRMDSLVARSPISHLSNIHIGATSRLNNQIGGSRSLLRYLGQAALQIVGVHHWEELDFRLELLE